jgi:DNA polymerase III subunit gamma/tau
MSYTVLARRYRSGTFDEVIGQDHVAQTLKRAIESGRIAHAYLFCGTRGVGKTSMARILAKALNCESSDGPTAVPCNKCNSCLAISRGDDIDVIEIDAASNRGIENIRDVISNAQFRPARSRFKVYIIDEVHGLTKDAFNALLKVLEEPPSHVKFILATTEPEKVLPTILSRCQRYDFRNIPTREIAGHLAEICKQEKIQADEDALLMVAKAGAGSMRDSLSLLDRLLSIGEKHLTLDMIEQLLGLPKAQLLFDLAEAIGRGDVKAALGQADAMIQRGMSVDSLIAALVDHLRNLLIVRTCGPDSTLVEVPGLTMKELAAQAGQFDAVAVTQDITLLEELRRQIRQSQAGRALLDATLVRMALADQFASVGELLSRVEGNGSGAPRSTPSTRSTPAAASAAQKKNLEPARAVATPPSVAAPVESPANHAVSTEPLATHPAPADEDDDDLPRPGKVWSNDSSPSLSTLMAQHRAATAAAAPPPAKSPAATPSPDANVEAVDPSDLSAVWQAFLALVATRGPMLHSLLSQGRLITIADGRAVIRFGPQHETFIRAWERNGKKDVVRDVISQVLSQSVGVKFELDGDPAPAPAPEPKASVAAARLPRTTADATPEPPPVPAPPMIKITPDLVESIRNAEPLVKDLMDRLGAQVIKVE